MHEGRGADMFLQDILDAIDAIGSFVEDMTFDEFQTDKRTIDAVVRNFGIIGEAVKNLPEDLRVENPDIPWRDVAGMRDKVIHVYFGVDLEIIWWTIKSRFPTFRDGIERVLSELR